MPVVVCSRIWSGDVPGTKHVLKERLFRHQPCKIAEPNPITPIVYSWDDRLVKAFPRFSGEKAGGAVLRPSRRASGTPQDEGARQV